MVAASLARISASGDEAREDEGESSSLRRTLVEEHQLEVSTWSRECREEYRFEFGRVNMSCCVC